MAMSAPSGPPGRPADDRGGAELPKREPGASPMAAAGAKAREAAAPAGGSAEYTMKHLGTRPARRSRRTITITTAVALLAASGVALASVIQLGGHAGRAGAAPSRAPAQPGAVSAPSAPA